jgi:hypothetical protein
VIRRNEPDIKLSRSNSLSNKIVVNLRLVSS